MKLVWTPQAVEDLGSIRQYIANDTPGAAKRIVATVTMTVHDQLIAFPESGRIGRVEGTREMIVPQTPFILAYRIMGASIEILGVHHSARRWPERFGV